MTKYFSIKRFPYSVNPWRVINTLTGQKVSMPAEIDHPSLGHTTIMCPLAFPRKREALAYLEEHGARLDTLYEAMLEGKEVSRQ
jgi:hypothetical protein